MRDLDIVHFWWLVCTSAGEAVEEPALLLAVLLRQPRLQVADVDFSASSESCRS
jgi:hypothetical protein